MLIGLLLNNQCSNYSQSPSGLYTPQLSFPDVGCGWPGAGRLRGIYVWLCGQNQPSALQWILLVACSARLGATSLTLFDTMGLHMALKHVSMSGNILFLVVVQYSAVPEKFPVYIPWLKYLVWWEFHKQQYYATSGQNFDAEYTGKLQYCDNWEFLWILLSFWHSWRMTNWPVDQDVNRYTPGEEV